MKELLETAAAGIETLRGAGRLLILFAAAVLVICFYAWNHKDNDCPEKEPHPAVFLLSFRTAIAYAFTKLLFSEQKKGKMPRILFRQLLLMLLCLTAVFLSGKRIISEEFYAPAANTLHIRTEYIMVMDRLLAEGAGQNVISVIAPPELSPYFKPYSSRFMPLYEYPKNGDPETLPEEARIVYHQFSTSVPDMKVITDVGHRMDYDWLIVDTGRYYPEFKASEFDYELVDTVGDYELYYAGDHREGGE
ncbi:MAG: hypothetical protein K6G83_11255 [Lachnospiraceae bacterium]|nr:hypothetical protein [Lachnospiraceae bacterium]